MLEIKGTTIEARRAEERRFNYSLKDYTFQVGDKLEFKIYKKRTLNEPPIVKAKIEVKNECKQVTFILSKEDMSLFPILNKEADYWYEIELNDKKTPAGYDGTGPKLFRVFPKGVESDDRSV